jgi:hypothetical protein
MANYGSIKTMKAASIGTIMPWVGDLTDIPAGWLICNGQVVAASTYPLLTQSIGNTYGGSGFSGTFPNYNGEISLPNISQRALQDIESSYFGTAGDNTSTNEALQALVSPGTNTSLIGTNTDNGVGTNYNAYTDLNFAYTPENDFTGKLTAATLNETFGQKTVYIAPRKLGRRHVTIHTHPTGFNTITPGNTGAIPGAGVATWGNINYNINRAPFDNLDYSTQVQMQVTYTGAQGFGGGVDGVVIANVQGENPSYNLKPFGVVGSPISTWFGPYQTAGTTNTNSMDQFFNPGETLLYASGGGSTTVQNRNYDNGDANSGGDADGWNKVMYDTNAISFNQNTVIAGQQAVILPHTHDSFEVSFDSANLRLPNTTPVNVTSNITPQNVDKALNLNVTTSTPSLICLYLIRAY